MRSAATVEDGAKLIISLMKRRLLVAHDSLARSLVSLRFHCHAGCPGFPLCPDRARARVRINSIVEQLSSDSAAAREAEQ